MDKSRELAHEQARAKQISEQIHVADVVIVQSFDETKKRVTVKPLVNRKLGANTVSAPPLLSVPVVMASMEVIPKITPGDIGVVLYLDLDSDNAISTGGEGPPNSGRIHTVDDAVFLGVLQKG